MKKLLMLLALGLCLAGCATMPPFASQPPFSPQKVDTGDYQLKVDNFVVILDASASMGTWVEGTTRLEVAKSIVSRMNQTLPEQDLQGALRTFGHSRSVSKEKTALMYGLSSYSKDGLQAGLKKVTKADGSTPLADAIDALDKDLGGTSGNIAVILVSDGEVMGDAPVDAAQRLKDKYRDRICIYAIAVDSNSAGKNYLAKLTQVGGCGYATDADKIAGSAEMSAFVKDVFFTEIMDADGDGVPDDKDNCPQTPAGAAVDQDGCPLDRDGDGVADDMDNCPQTPQGVDVDPNGCAVDADGDGVADYLDKCPQTPQGVEVDPSGCPLDSDGDGVPNFRDACPDTPAGEAVDANGCSAPAATQSAKVLETGTWLYEDIKFDTGSDNIKPASYGVLAEIAMALKQNPSLEVEIQGHTDSAGSLVLNNKLSEDRANAVRQYLVDQGVPPEQMSAVGYGPSRPLAPNDTPDGRAHNRRVELKPVR